MKKFLTIALILLLALSVFLGLRAYLEPEEARIVFPFEPSQVENVELFHYEGAPADAQKKLVTAPDDIQALCESFTGITYLIKETEAVAGSPVYSFRFNLTDGTSYELIYTEYGVKNGEIFSPSGDFRYFTSANIGALWYNMPPDPVPAEQWELPTLDGSHPTKEPTPVPTATEVLDPFDAILYENGTFWDNVYGEVTLSEYCEKFHEETRIFAVPLKAARVDMDGDWTEELAVVITELEHMLILHIQDGRVEGRVFHSTEMEELKDDGTFRWRGHRGLNGISVMEFDEWATRCIAMQTPEDEQPYYIDPELFPAYQKMDAEDAFLEISLMQDRKPDAPWVDLPHGPIPTDPPLVLTDSEQTLVDVVMRNNEFYDLDEDKMTSLPQYLNEFTDLTQTSVGFLQQASVDFDGDGEKELVLWIRVGDFNDYGFLVLHYENGHVEGQTFVYRQMSELKTDGTFLWSGSAGYNGVSRLIFGDAGWELEVIHQVDYDMTTTPYQYMVDGAEASKEEFDRAIDDQLAKESVTWVGLESVLELFR